MTRLSDEQLSNIFKRDVCQVSFRMKYDKIFFHKFRIYRIRYLSDYYDAKPYIYDSENPIVDVVMRNRKIKRTMKETNRKFRLANKGEKADSYIWKVGVYVIWTE